MFDLDRIESHPYLAQLVYRDETPSTSDLALELVAEHRLATPALVLAGRQTAGRGRGTNRWWSDEGALTFSLVLSAEQLNLETERWPQVSLAAAVAVCGALEELVPNTQLGVKWPNDVYAEGRKLSGILVEVPYHAAAMSRHVVVGVGVNVNNCWRWAPDDVQQRGVSLRDLTDDRYDLSDVLIALLDQFEERLAQLSLGDARLANAWRSLCVLRARTVFVDQAGRIVGGLCEGIDAEGALVLQTERGAERVFGGVVQSIE